MSAWLIAVVAINFLLQLVVSAARPLTSVRALGLGANSFELGLLAAAYAALALIAAVPIGRAIDRRGATAFIVLGSLLLAGMLLATAVANSTIALIAIQSGIGLGLIGANLGMQGTIALTSSPQASMAAYGHYSTGAGIGQLAGPAIVGLLVGMTGAHSGTAVNSLGASQTTPAFIILGTVTIFATLVARALPALGARSPKAAPKAPSAVKTAEVKGLRRAILRQAGLKPVLAASAIFITSLDLLAIYMPAFGLQRSYSVTYVGLLLSVAAAGSIAARVLSGVAARMLGRPKLMLLSLLAPALALALLPLLPAATVPLDMLIVGMGLGSGQPLTMSWTASLADTNRRAATLGVRVSGNRVGQLIVPIIVGAVISRTSLAAGFWTMAILLAATAVFFAPMLRTTSDDAQ